MTRADLDKIISRAMEAASLGCSLSTFNTHDILALTDEVTILREVVTILREVVEGLPRCDCGVPATIYCELIDRHSCDGGHPQHPQDLRALLPNVVDLPYAAAIRKLNITID